MIGRAQLVELVAMLMAESHRANEQAQAQVGDWPLSSYHSGKASGYSDAALHTLRLERKAWGQ